jgi:hypothetical protein
VANDALHSFAAMEDNSRDTLEYMKREAAREYQITMSTRGDTSKELCARRNDIAKKFMDREDKDV